MECVWCSAAKINALTFSKYPQWSKHRFQNSWLLPGHPSSPLPPPHSWWPPVSPSLWGGHMVQQMLGPLCSDSSHSPFSWKWPWLSGWIIAMVCVCTCALWSGRRVKEAKGAWFASCRCRLEVNIWINRVCFGVYMEQTDFYMLLNSIC